MSQINMKRKKIRATYKIILCIVGNLATLSGVKAAEVVLGAVASKTAISYVQPYIDSVYTWFKEAHKTFDNEFNEAVCGIERDKLRLIVEESLKAFDQKFKSYAKLMGDADLKDFNVPILRDLATGALIHLQRYELALISLDFIHHTKTLLDGKLEELQNNMKASVNPRYLGQTNAKQIQLDQNRSAQEAQENLSVWKCNLFAALTTTYPYVSEGGCWDRLTRRMYRHRKRANYWGLEPNFWGNVAVPQLKTHNYIPPDETSLKSPLIELCRKPYEYTYELILKRIDSQIGIENLDYITGLQTKFKELFPDKKNVSSEGIEIPAFLVEYIAFLKAQQAPKPQSVVGADKLGMPDNPEDAKLENGSSDSNKKPEEE